MNRTQSSTDSRRVWIVAAALVALNVLLALLSFDPTPHIGGDNAAYIALGRSLLEHGSYLDLYGPATPPHTQYPPVFPGILAVAMSAGIVPWVGLKLIVVAFSALAVGATYFWMRHRSGPGAALAVTLLVAVTPVVLNLSHWIISDVPGWAFIMVGLWAYDALEQGGRGKGTVAASATVLAYFTRSAGLPLALAAGAWLLVRRRWRDLALLALGLGPLAVAWWLRARMEGGVPYASQFSWVNPYDPALGHVGAGDLVRRVLDNSFKYSNWYLPELMLGRGGTVPVALSFAVIAAALVGWMRRLRRPGVGEFFFPCYLGLILLWPTVYSDVRFLLPAYPLILAYAAETGAWCVQRFRPTALLPIGISATAWVLLLALPRISSGVERGMTCMALYRTGVRYPCLEPVWRDLFDLAVWAERWLPDDAVALSQKPRLFYGLSGIRGQVYPRSDDPTHFWAMVEEVGAKYVISDQVGGLSTRYLSPVIAAQPERFCALALAPGGTAALLGIVPEGAAADAQSADGRFAPCPESYRRPLPR